MPDEASARMAAQRETLLYFVLLRQIEADCAAMHDAFGRLAQAASESIGWDPSTIILDWLESELRTVRASAQPNSPVGAQLISAAVALAKALKQLDSGEEAGAVMWCRLYLDASRPALLGI